MADEAQGLEELRHEVTRLKLQVQQVREALSRNGETLTKILEFLGEEEGVEESRPAAPPAA